MLSQEQVQSFERDGFLNSGPMLDESLIDELHQELEAIIARGPEGFADRPRKPVLYRNLSGDDNAPVWQIVNLWEASPVFEKLIHHPGIAGAISQLTGMRSLQVWHDQVQYKPSGKGGVNYWHQDAPLWPTIMPHTPVSAWIPLRDADQDNGCMWMIPGSHKWGNNLDHFRKLHTEKPGRDFFDLGEGFTPPADAPLREVKPVCWPVKKGEVSFHHSLTWHGSPRNLSDRTRPAIAIHYMTSEAVFVAGTGHPMAKFIHLPDGAPMSQAGEHFPHVWKDGKPVAQPASCDCQAG